jgi:hypothetical protein
MGSGCKKVLELKKYLFHRLNLFEVDFSFKQVKEQTTDAGHCSLSERWSDCTDSGR